jgi:HSP20 family molecular chaperone IbpA
MTATATQDEFRHMTHRLSKLTAELLEGHFGEFCPVESWVPAVNVYRLPRRVEVCVDLAGLDARTIEVQVERGRLMVRGFRAPPEPRQGREGLRIVAMEIDHGPFCRTIQVPEEVDAGRIRTEYTEGMLWVRLPLRAHG